VRALNGRKGVGGRASVNDISRKQQRVRACSGRAGVNGRARKNAGVRVYRARKHQRARAGWAGGGGERA
jgi:hypothetical protein